MSLLKSAFAIARQETCTSVSSSVVLQKRGLKIARSAFGFYLARYGRRQYPPWRRPYNGGEQAIGFSAPHYFFQHCSKTQSAFLPACNYITGDWRGLSVVSREQVYTLQHALSGSPTRIRRFPTVFEFTNVHSRWLIGKSMRANMRPRTLIFDEEMLTKKQRLDYVKAGLLPK